MLRNGSMAVLHQINTVHCLVLPEASKNSLTCECYSTYYFGIQKATGLLKPHVDFGVGDETRNRNYLQAWKSCFVRGKFEATASCIQNETFLSSKLRCNKFQKPKQIPVRRCFFMLTIVNDCNNLPRLQGFFF